MDFFVLVGKRNRKRCETLPVVIKIVCCRIPVRTARTSVILWENFGQKMWKKFILKVKFWKTCYLYRHGYLM